MEENKIDIPEGGAVDQVPSNTFILDDPQTEDIILGALLLAAAAGLALLATPVAILFAIGLAVGGIWTLIRDSKVTSVLGDDNATLTLFGMILSPFLLWTAPTAGLIVSAATMLLGYNADQRLSNNPELLKSSLTSRWSDAIISLVDNNIILVILSLVLFFFLIRSNNGQQNPAEKQESTQA